MAQENVMNSDLMQRMSQWQLPVEINTFVVCPKCSHSFSHSIPRIQLPISVLSYVVDNNTTSNTACEKRKNIDYSSTVSNTQNDSRTSNAFGQNHRNSLQNSVKKHHSHRYSNGDIHSKVERGTVPSTISNTQCENKMYNAHGKNHCTPLNDSVTNYPTFNQSRVHYKANHDTVSVADIEHGTRNALEQKRRNKDQTHNSSSSSSHNNSMTQLIYCRKRVTECDQRVEESTSQRANFPQEQIGKGSNTCIFTDKNAYLQLFPLEQVSDRHNNSSTAQLISPRQGFTECHQNVEQSTPTSQSVTLQQQQLRRGSNTGMFTDGKVIMQFSPFQPALPGSLHVKKNNVFLLGHVHRGIKVEDGLRWADTTHQCVLEKLLCRGTNGEPVTIAADTDLPVWPPRVETRSNQTCTSSLSMPNEQINNNLPSHGAKKLALENEKLEAFLSGDLNETEDRFYLQDCLRPHNQDSICSPETVNPVESMDGRATSNHSPRIGQANVCTPVQHRSSTTTVHSRQKSYQNVSKKRKTAVKLECLRFKRECVPSKSSLETIKPCQTPSKTTEVSDITASLQELKLADEGSSHKEKCEYRMSPCVNGEHNADTGFSILALEVRLEKKIQSSYLVSTGNSAHFSESDNPHQPLDNDVAYRPGSYSPHQPSDSELPSRQKSDSPYQPPDNELASRQESASPHQPSDNELASLFNV